ncbi:ABC transporter ATP-binding protein [Synechococcus sp. PCC 7336]|uniref:ABC transporter ATP-binding protein n=1 Tax=Synechococcus sp. PCC 7336 TaxID=195250 RepID=UPI000348586D|nr:ABC transporter ATP-binding protein [Synechococcus sp. PCC 7336]
MAAVRLEGIEKSFGGTPALHAIDLEIRDREFMVLVGPSGCGKSTLLRIVAGLESPTRGEVTIGDRPVTHLPPKARDIAMVFQSYALYPHLNVYDNLAFGLRRQGRRSHNPFSPERSHQHRAIDLRVRDIAKQLQIDALLQRKPKELSGGQKQRVALGRAMARNPQVFLLDEPLSNLDAQLRLETRSQIVRLQRQLETTAIYVTHDQTEAMTMGDRIAVLRSGYLQQVDTPLNLYRQPANQFVAQFIGSPPMNFLPVTLDANGELRGSDLRQPLSSNELWSSQLPPHTPLTLGFRPERAMPAIPEEAHLIGTVQTVEVLGAQTIVATELEAGRSIQVIVAPELGYRPGERVGWRLQGDRLHFFERESGRAVSHPERAAIV